MTCCCPARSPPGATRSPGRRRPASCGDGRPSPRFDGAGVAGPVAGADERAAGPFDTDLLLRGPCAINSLCIRRTVIDRIGAFDTAYRLAADREWMLRAWIAEVPLLEIDRAVYRYLMHDGSSTIDRARKNFALVRRENIAIAQHYMTGEAARRASAETLRAVRQWHAAETTMLASHQLRGGELGESARYHAAGLPHRAAVAAARRARGRGLAVEEGSLVR